MANERPGPLLPSAEAEEENLAPSMFRGVVVTLAAVGLVIGILASLPSGSHKATGATVNDTGHTTTETTVPGAGSTTSTTTAVNAVHVAVLAPAGSPDEQSVRASLLAAHDIIVPEAAIPASWVGSMTAPVIHYPPGLESEALTVASTLKVPSSEVSEEATGTSDGSDVVEVFCPAAS